MVGVGFTIRLEANETTGYTWRGNERFDRSYLELTGSPYLPAQPQRPGSGGEQRYHFKALKAGSTQIEVTYKRSWEATPSDKTSHLDILNRLPKTNCRECRQASCLTFSVAVFQGKKPLADCPYLEEEGSTSARMGAGEGSSMERDAQKALENLQARIREIMNSAAHGSEDALAELVPTVVRWIQGHLGGKRHAFRLAPIRDRRSVRPQKDPPC
jgi:inhibitor of cysteine peptidase